MDRQLSIETEGNHYHLIFHNYRGPYEGHKIGDYLGLEEDESPPEGEDPPLPEVGHYYLHHPMDFHPDLHALVDRDKLERVASMVVQMRLHVMKGLEFLPQTTEPPPPLKVDPEAEHLSITEEMESLHQSVWHKGPKAVITAFLARLIPLAIIVFVGIVLSRHIGDKYTAMGLDAAFDRARRAPVAQGFVGSIISPDHSDKISLEIRGVNFLEGNRFITGAGNVLSIEGVREIRSIFEAARANLSAPIVKSRIRDGRLVIDKVIVADQNMLNQGWLVQEAKLPPSAEEPRRGAPGTEGVFQIYPEVSHTDSRGLATLEGQRLAVEGVVRMEDERLVLRLEEGSGLDLAFQGTSAKTERLLNLFAGTTSTIDVDVVLTSIYPWLDEDNPSRSRETSKIIGEAQVYSASAQNYHAVDRR